MSTTVTNTAADLNGATLVKTGGDQTITGNKTFDRGTNPPFTVGGGAAMVSNLDAEKLAGKSAPAGDLVGTTDAQNLTNKTLTGGVLTGTFTGDPVFDGVPAFEKYTETRTAPAIGGAALAIDCDNGTCFKVALNANCTVTLSHPPAAGKMFALVIIFTADGTIRTITWPAAVVWAGGVAPTMTGTNNKRDIISLLTEDGGTTWFGSVVGQNY